MASSLHTVTGAPAQCIGCVACTKACPVKALRVRDGLVRCDSELCIDCGSCIYVCKNGARRARTSRASDLSNYKHTVAMPSLTLYGQFGNDVTPDQVLLALTHVGFDSCYDISYMCEWVTAAQEAYLSECAGPWPKINITCPAILRLVQIRYPDLIPHLMPIEIPRELAAQMRRKQLSSELGLRPAEIGIFSIVPCPSIIRSITDPVGIGASNIDGAFSIQEMFGPLLKAIKAGPSDAHYENGISARGLSWSLGSGESGAMKNSNTLRVTGVHDVTRVFDRIESGKYQSVDFIEAYICPEGCVSGQLVAEGRFAANRTLARIAQRLGARPRVKEEKVRSLLRDHFFDLETEIRSREVRPITRDLRQAIAVKREKTRLLQALPAKNCGACGAPDCDTHAEDVIRGESKLDGCVFLKIQSLQQQLKTAKAGGSDE
jgi:Fe-S-cluster-containing hydrogenase component 2